MRARHEGDGDGIFVPTKVIFSLAEEDGHIPCTNGHYPLSFAGPVFERPVVKSVVVVVIRFYRGISTEHQKKKWTKTDNIHGDKKKGQG